MNNPDNMGKLSPAVFEAMDSAAEFPVLRVEGEEKNSVKMMVAREFPLTIILNDLELVTLLCTPTNLDYLAVGFLFAEGLINNRDEIKQITVDDRRGVVRVTTQEGKELAHELLFKRLITSACGRGAAFYTAADAQHPDKVESSIVISPEEVSALVKEFNERSVVYEATHGVHSAALCDNKNILVFSNDLGRHNAIDRVFGECILKGIPTEDRLIITSGRTPSEMVLKVAKGKIPILISASVPTDLGMRLATDLGITIIGFVRGEKMNVYTGDWRIC
jgi:FdhD protein